MALTRLYHSLSLFYSSLHRHRKIVLSLTAVLLLVLYLRPLFPYLGTGLSLTRDFILGDTRSLRSDNSRINLLVLGLDGPKNDPAGRTDTMIFASFSSKGDPAVLLSLPRDIWIPEMRAKLNTAYHYGNQVDGLGIEWARRLVSEIVGQQVHDVVVVSFEGFVEAIDLLGGVDIEVERSFTDGRYPITGKENDDCNGDPDKLCRYETVSFEQGLQHMGGEESLKFARSRNAEGPEGTDFARAARQQKTILAIKDKILTPAFLFNPQRVSKMIEVLGQTLETDIPQSHLGELARVIVSADRSKMRSEVLYTGEEDSSRNFLFNPPTSYRYGYQWVLIPRADTWQPAQGWIECLLTDDECPVEEFTKEIKD